MSKSLKTIVAVAAMVAVPYFAPMIASSAALAGVSATLGTTATTALVGAGLGAAKGVVLGEDVGRSALMGGISGGIAGYTAAPAAAPTISGGAPVFDYDAASNSLVAAPGYATPTAPFGLSNVPTDSLIAANATVDPMAQLNANQGFSNVDTGYQYASSGAAAPAEIANAATTAGRAANFGTTAAAGTAAAGTAAAPQTYGEALRARLTSPAGQADFTLRAAGMLAGSALAGSGLSPEEETLLRQQTEELRQLQQTNQALFNQRLEQAQSLVGESKYFDPEYFGLQSARRAQTAGAVAKRAGLRGLTGDRREAEARRYDIESGRRTGTAYDTGFQSAISPRLQTMSAGLSMMPTSGPSVNYTGLQNAYSSAARRQRETQQDIGDLFGTLTSNSRSRGPL